MQMLFDFLPIIAFFVTFKVTGDIFIATGVIIAAVIVATAIQWFRHRKVSPMALISAVLVLIFGGLTLLIHDQAFIQWKVTIVNWLFAAGFLASRFFGDKVIIQRMMGEQMQLDTAVWRRLNWAWIGFFTVLGAINLYVMYNFPLDVWVSFKMYGLIGLTAAFAIGQGLWLASKMPPETEPQSSSK